MLQGLLDGHSMQCSVGQETGLELGWVKLGLCMGLG